MKQGFTLIELVIAMLFGGIILSVLFNSFFVATRVSRMVDTTVSQDLRIALLQNQLEKDLVSAFIPFQAQEEKKAEEKKVEADKKEAQDKAEAEKKAAEADEKKLKILADPFISKNEADRLQVLSFISNNMLPLYEKEKGVLQKPRVMRIAYRLVPEEKKKDSFSLMRQESNNLEFAAFDPKSAKPVKMFEIASGVKSFKVKYQVEKKPKEKEEKKSKEIAAAVMWPDKQLKEQITELLPQWVEIDIALWNDTHQDERSYKLLMPIGVRG